MWGVVVGGGGVGVVWGEDGVAVSSARVVISCARGGQDDVAGGESCRTLGRGLSRYLCIAMWTLIVNLLILLFRSSHLSAEYLRKFRDIFAVLKSCSRKKKKNRLIRK